MNRKLNEIELFAGAGGLLDGFESTGKYHLLAAVEWLHPQVAVLRDRLSSKYGIPKSRVKEFDITRTKDLFNGWKNDPRYGTDAGLDDAVGNNYVDVISGGPPCQAYSLAGRIRDKHHMKKDYRNFLFESYIKVVNHYKPKIIVFENVEGILTAIPTGEKITDLIRADFRKSGYEIVDNLRKYALQNFNDYGVPQKRKRVIIIGIRKDSKSFDYQKLLHYFYTDILPSQKVPKEVRKKRNVRYAIGDLPPIYPLKHPKGRKAYNNNNHINGHQSRFHNQRDKSIFRELAADIEHAKATHTKPKYASTKALKELYYKKTGKKSRVHKYHVLRWDRPSNTITAHLKKDGLRYIHPDPKQARSITVREAARIQTFPDDFKFDQSMCANFDMIGNAVPPMFAHKLAEVIPRLIKLCKQNKA